MRINFTNYGADFIDYENRHTTDRVSRFSELLKSLESKLWEISDRFTIQNALPIPLLVVISVKITVVVEF